MTDTGKQGLSPLAPETSTTGHQPAMLVHHGQLARLVDEALAAVVDRKLAIVLFDLNSFRETSSSLGHVLANQLLRLVAARLVSNHPAATVIGLGGDEFVLLAEVDDRAAALDFAVAVAAAFDSPFLPDSEHSIVLSAAIGVAVGSGGDSGDSGASLVNGAESAMYEAKRERNGVVVFEAEQAHPTGALSEMIASLHEALENGDLYLDYQPKIGLETRRIAGVEALVRWRHASGNISPAQFIPAAERAGLMPRITDAILEMALAEVREWRRKGFEVPVAVNLSTADLLEPGFVEGLSEKLARHRIPSSHLTLEVTERVLANDLGSARTVMGEISRLGVKMALDDFGTGWSSLLGLRTLPVSEVKLDRSFASLAIESDQDRSLVAKVVELCHTLELTVVAEGVETEQVLEQLTRIGCDEAQGWHVGKPMSPDQVMVWSADYLAANNLADLGLPRQGVLTAAASAAAALAALADVPSQTSDTKVYSLDTDA